MLRFTTAPGVEEDLRIAEMTDFCLKSGIDDVMVFTSCEELNTGHVTKEELKAWFDIYEKVKAAVSPHNITVSLNPWTTTLHCDRGRTLKEGQNFRTMTDRHGLSAEAVACPADEDFLDYIAGIYAEYARLHPAVLWLEDDLRLHNHSPLDWGGCFCDYHMQLFEERIGHPVTREEFAAAVCAEGDVHPYRKVWLDVARDTIINLTSRIADAVFAVDPDIRLGLMCSMPYVHCAEGRDWARLTDALTGNHRPYVRIHLPAYEEPSAQRYSFDFSAISRLCASYLPKDIEITPELENFPYSAFTKSNTFSNFQIQAASLLPSVGITMNIFDMMGNGIVSEERFDSMLHNVKPFLNSTVSMSLSPDNDRGVAVLTSPTSSWRVHSTNPSSFTGLYPRENLAACLLSAFSVSNHYAVDEIPSSGVVAVSGQALRTYTNAQLDRIFSENRIILDGESVLTLADLGRLDLIGARSAKIADIPAYQHAMEEFTVPLCGKNRFRMSAQDNAGKIVSIDFSDSLPRRTLAFLCDPNGNAVIDTICELDGRILILPYSDYPEDFGRRRCRALMELVADFANVTHTKVPYLNVFEYISNGQRVIALVNMSGDDHGDITVYTDNAGAFRTASVYTEGNPDGDDGILGDFTDNSFKISGVLEHHKVLIIKQS